MGTLTQSLKHSKPKQYIRGWVEFYKLKFKVTPDVLIPRPETELLVDEVIRFADHPLTILDIGTGCGNIAIALAKNLPAGRHGLNGHPGGVRIIATDISQKALKIAKQNAKFHGVSNKIIFIKSDLLSNVHPRGVTVIVANLPYIPTARIPYLDPSVKDFEPLVALDGGPDGFDLYRKLFQQIKHKFIRDTLGVNVIHLPGGLRLIVCEIDYTHGELAALEAQKYFPNAEIEVKTDLAKKQRILKITLPEFLPV